MSNDMIGRINVNLTVKILNYDFLGAMFILSHTIDHDTDLG
jgi:hypothetical protein